MSEEKLYAVCIRESSAYNWGLGAVNGQPTGMTIRSFVDMEIGTWIKYPSVLIEVTLKEFVNDMKAGFSESKYAKMLGWNYGLAAEMVESEGKIFILMSQPHFEARPYSYDRARDDDDYALQLVRDIYSIRGGRIILEEFDREKHVIGYKPKLDS
jgi:hypothetical protein